MSSDEEPDDDQVLWAVQEITAERGRKYRVKWVGTDPATGKPWAQSWVARHDCTDDLVVEWKAKKQRRAEWKKRASDADRALGGRKGTASRTSGSSKRAGSSMSAKVMRPTTSEATTSRTGSTREQHSAPPKERGMKRKRWSVTPTATPSGARKADEESDPSRPSKRQKIALEKLLPPLSSDEDDAPALLDFQPKVVAQDKALLKSADTASDDSDDDDGSLPTLGAELVGPSDARPRAASVSSRASDLREGSKPGDSRGKVMVVIRRKERVVVEDGALSASRDEELQQHKQMKKPSSLRMTTPERNDDTSEKEEALPVLPIKIGPPRGVKRKNVLRKTGQPSTLRASRTKIREVDSGDARVSTGKSNGRPGHEVAAPEKPSRSQQDVVDSPTSLQPPLRVSIPPVSLNVRPCSPVLSPGTVARLELFDQLMAQLDAAPSPVDISEYIPDGTHFNHDDNYDTHETFYPPHPLSPPPSNSNLKHVELGTLNGLIVPETESSRNSQSQPQALTRLSSLPQPPQAGSARQPVDLPAIAVISPSAPSTSASPQGLFPPPRKPLPSIHRPLKRPKVKPLPQISPNTFRSAIKARSRITDPDPPPSSIESFASPKRVDKGKQRAVEVDELQSGPYEGEGDGKRKKVPMHKITDSLLRRRGKELFNLAQLAREAERRKKKKAKQLKTVDDIVNQTVSSPAKAPPPSTDVVELTMDQWDGVVNLTSGANSATLDTVEHSEAKPLGEEERERLRIDLRQEEEESTQEALGIYPPPPVEVSMDGQDAQKSPPRSPKDSSFGGQLEGVDHVEQPSTDLQLASVIVHPSQEQQHEDMDIDSSPPNKPNSSPPRPVLENLTDSPKRRLGEALSLLNVKSEEIQRLERELADGRQNVENLQAELTKTQQSSEPTEPVRAAWEAERAQWAEDHSKWEKDQATWETQRKEWSDDKANLTSRVTELSEAVTRAEEVGVELSELEAERVSWTKEREALRSEITQQADELTALAKIRGEHDLDRSKWEAEKASWAEEKARWETERAALQEKQEASSRSVDELTASVESLTSAKASAEKDRDFFREQYVQASGFVNSVRDENLELEERVKIAEGQAQEGVGSIKALYEGRVKALQADVGRWKKMSELMQEKDRRTNDELRLRAAQVPELGHLCARLVAVNKILEAEVRKLSRAQRRGFVQENKLYRQLSALQKERRSLKAKLAKTVDSGTQDTSHSVDAPPVVQDPDSVDPNDMEILPDPTPQSFDSTAEEPALYPCMWRPQWRDQCQLIFDAKEDLERHMRDHFCDLANE